MHGHAKVKYQDMLLWTWHVKLYNCPTHPQNAMTHDGISKDVFVSVLLSSSWSSFTPKIDSLTCRRIRVKVGVLERGQQRYRLWDLRTKQMDWEDAWVREAI